MIELSPTIGKVVLLGLDTVIVLFWMFLFAVVVVVVFVFVLFLCEEEGFCFSSL